MMIVYFIAFSVVSVFCDSLGSATRLELTLSIRRSQAQHPLRKYLKHTPMRINVQRHVLLYTKRSRGKQLFFNFFGRAILLTINDLQRQPLSVHASTHTSQTVGFIREGRYSPPHGFDLHHGKGRVLLAHISQGFKLFDNPRVYLIRGSIRRLFPLLFDLTPPFNHFRQQGGILAGGTRIA